jgi:hypothetical protein
VNNDDFQTIRSALKIAEVTLAGGNTGTVAEMIPETIAALDRIEHKMIRLRGENMGLLSQSKQPIYITINSKKVKLDAQPQPQVLSDPEPTDG